MCMCPDAVDRRRWTLTAEAVRRMPGLGVVHLFRSHRR
jgi:hypothetical protein